MVRFRAKLWPSLVMGLVVVLCLFLSHWQWQRYHLKQALAASYQAQITAPAVDLPQVLTTLPAKTRAPIFLSVRVSGQYDNQRQIVLDNRSHQGRAGYEVFTPFLLNTTPKTAILIDRGFIPSGRYWHQLPDLSVATTSVHLNGFLVKPEASFKLGPAIETVTQPMRVARIDIPVLQAHYPYPLLPYIVLLKPKQSGSYVCEWSYPSLFAQRSLGYTFQWLALALAALIAWLIISIKRTT